MFFDSFVHICELKGIAPTKVLIDTGISRSGVTRWKEGNDPKNETKKKIADYFGITIEELNEGKIKKLTLPPEDELSELDKEFIRLLREATPEQVQRIRDFAAGVLASRQSDFSRRD